MKQDELNHLLKNAEKEMLDLNHPYVGSEHLLLSILKNNNRVTTLLKEYDITYSVFKKSLIKVIGKGTIKSTRILYTPLLKRIIKNSKEECDNVTSKELLLSLIEEGDGIAIRILISIQTDIDCLYNDIKSLGKISKYLSYGLCLNDTIDKKYKIVERNNNIENVIEILFRKNKSNVLLIGNAGVGKTAIVEELARRIELKKVPELLQNYKIISLDMSELVAGTKYRGEFEEKLNNLLKETISKKNIILFIDEIHTIVKAGGAEGAIEAANILKPYLARNTIKCIGATTINEYNKYIKKDKALERRFECVIINEPNDDSTLKILTKIKKHYEEYHNVKITNSNIKDILFYSNKYINNRCNPDKSIDILDLVCTKANINGISITKRFIENTIQEKMNILNYNSLCNERNNKIVNSKYEEEITTILNNIRESKYFNIINGEQEELIINIIKEFSSLFNSVPIIIDMSLFSDITSVNKLIGSSAGYVGYEDEGILNIVNSNPSKIFIIKNIEKAHIKVKEIFNMIITDGYINNNRNEKLVFTNSLIFFISNKKESSIGFNKLANRLDLGINCNNIIEFKNIHIVS